MHFVRGSHPSLKLRKTIGKAKETIGTARKTTETGRKNIGQTRKTIGKAEETKGERNENNGKTKKAYLFVKAFLGVPILFLRPLKKQNAGNCREYRDSYLFKRTS